MNLTICIGLAKTGSSFFRQKIFPNCKDTLKIYGLPDEKNPISELINYIGKLQQIYSRDFNAKIIDINIVDQFKSKIDKFLKNVKETNVVINWPSFVGSFGGARDDFNSMEHISDVLQRIFGRVKILLIIRKQDDYIYSLYTTYLKRGGYNEIDKFINLNFAKQPKNEISIKPQCCDWNKIFDIYLKNHFRVLCIPYELIKTKPEIFFNDIFKFLNIKIPEIVNEKINFGYTSASQELLRKFSKFKKILGKKLISLIGYESLSKFKKALLAKEFIRTHNFFVYLENYSLRNFLDKYDKYLKIIPVKNQKKRFYKKYSKKIIFICSNSNKELDKKLSNYDLYELGYFKEEF